MRLALNGATIIHSPIEDDVEIAAACGYTALEIWAGKLGPYLRSHTLEQLSERMRACAIAPWCINSIEDITYRDAAGRGALLEELRSMVGAARVLGAPSIVVVPGPQPDGRSRGDAVRESVDVLRSMSDVAGDTGLAFEFLGKPGCSVPVLDMAIEIVGRVDRPNVGMVMIRSLLRGRQQVRISAASRRAALRRAPQRLRTSATIDRRAPPLSG
jgi:sugar phosphate isomerase/epimerase